MTWVTELTYFITLHKKEIIGSRNLKKIPKFYNSTEDGEAYFTNFEDLAWRNRKFGTK